MAPLPAGIYRLLSVRPGLYRLHDLYRCLVAPKPHTNGVDRGCDLYYVELAGCDDAVGAADLGPYLQRSTRRPAHGRSEEHTSELQSLMRISYAVFCLKKNKLI